MNGTDGVRLNRTALYDVHVSCGAKMVPFAGYEMPVRFFDGVLKEHLHTRAAAGLFDVSHMGQLYLHGVGAAAALEMLVPGDIQALPTGRTRYTQLTSETGGILDDLMVTKGEDRLFVVVNAACKAADIELLRAGLPSDIAIEVLEDRSLIALQGPAAAAVLSRFIPDLVTMPFMSSTGAEFQGISCIVNRCGYTGEDGFEISVVADGVESLADALLSEKEVAPIGLGARDSLRLEAGLCLYGHDIGETTTPIEADLQWSIGKRRRVEGGFPGDSVILKQIASGAPRKRVGLKPEGRAPAREGTKITDRDGNVIGTVTSGGFGPTVKGPVSMGYVAQEYAEVGEPILLEVSSKVLPAAVTRLPFTPQNYYRR